MDKLPVAFSFFNEIAIIDQLAMTVVTGTLPAGLSVAGFALLDRFVRIAPDGESPARLAALFQVSRPTMSHTLGRLLAQGLIALDTVPGNRRSKIARITAMGRSRHAEALDVLMPVLAEVEEVLGRDVLETLTPALASLRERLDRMRQIEA